MALSGRFDSLGNFDREEPVAMTSRLKVTTPTFEREQVELASFKTDSRDTTLVDQS